MTSPDPTGPCKLLVHSERGGFTWLWNYPHALDDLRQRWTEFATVQRSFQKSGPTPSPDPAFGEFDTLDDASLGTILAWADNADARMNIYPDGVKVIPKGGVEFTLPWSASKG
jgi:hypothetical protein